MKNLSNSAHHKPISNNFHGNDDSKRRNASEPQSQAEAKAIAIPLFVLMLICIVIFVLKMKYGKRKVGVFSYEHQQLVIPDENCRNLRFKTLIGRGSFGVVWKAVLDDQIFVAVKMCSAEKHEKWKKEKNILCEDLNHRNIIKLIGSEIRKIKEETALLLIFEYLSEGELRYHLAENIISLEKLFFFIQSLFNGLSYLHSWKDSNGRPKSAIAHRDIKSSNILISDTRGCVIADFGLAVSLDQPAVYSWRDNKLQVGTARYMSPEKLSGMADYNDAKMALCKMDVYAAAIVSYEITSRCCFAKDITDHRFFSPKEFKLPFADLVGPRPTNDEMKRIVVDQNFRPEMELEWNSNELLHKMTALIETCWNRDATRRLTSQQMLNEVKQLYLSLELQSCYSCKSSQHETSIELDGDLCIAQVHNSPENPAL